MLSLGLFSVIQGVVCFLKDLLSIGDIGNFEYPNHTYMMGQAHYRSPHPRPRHNPSHDKGGVEYIYAPHSFKDSIIDTGIDMIS